ncbi:ATP-binding cassette domain-containing protein, partial [Escherichia coli]|uniref:ATP-binding cassette domain-containing protein n=1 Tax=Escherichia coli TaxID=562 RepID=UPI00390C5D3C
ELKSFFGVVFQDYHIYPVSIRDNLSINGAIAASEIIEAIQKVGLQNRIHDIDDVIGKELSDQGLMLTGGERQRLALARMIVNDF